MKYVLISLVILFFCLAFAYYWLRKAVSKSPSIVRGEYDKRVSEEGGVENGD